MMMTRKSSQKWQYSLRYCYVKNGHCWLEKPANVNLITSFPADNFWIQCTSDFEIFMSQIKLRRNDLWLADSQTELNYNIQNNICQQYLSANIVQNCYRFERLLGPCVDILKRNIGLYQSFINLDRKISYWCDRKMSCIDYKAKSLNFVCLIARINCNISLYQSFTGRSVIDVIGWRI